MTINREQIIHMAREAGFPVQDGCNDDDWILAQTRFAALVAAAEREACARVCEVNQMSSHACANLIRARGEQK